MDLCIDQCQNYHDSRGGLVQFISEQFLAERQLGFGQVYILTFDGQNVVRGNHYHLHSTEFFCLVHGQVEMALEDIETKERYTQVFTAGNDLAVRVRIEPKIAHAVKSLSDSAVLVSYSSKMYDPLDEDKYAYNLL